MKDKNKISDILHNADEKALEEIAADYTSFDKEKADRQFRQIERRLESSGDDFCGEEVSGVERYRPRVFRRFVSAAACLALAGTGIAVTYSLSRNGFPGGSAPAASVASTPAAPDISSIDKNHVCELLRTSLTRYDSCYCKYNSLHTFMSENKETSEKIKSMTDTVSEIQFDRTNRRQWQKSVEQFSCDDLTNGKEHSSDYKNELYNFYCNGEGIEALIQDSQRTYTTYSKNYRHPPVFEPEENAVPWYMENKDCWEITGSEVITGRSCIVVECNVKDYKDMANYDSYDLNSTMYIDAETGYIIKEYTYITTVSTNSHTKTTEVSEQTIDFEVTEIKFNDTSGFVTPNEFREFLRDFETAEECDISFLTDEEIPTDPMPDSIVIGSNGFTVEIPHDFRHSKTDECADRYFELPLQNGDKVYFVFEEWVMYIADHGDITANELVQSLHNKLTITSGSGYDGPVKEKTFTLNPASSENTDVIGCPFVYQCGTMNDNESGYYEAYLGIVPCNFRNSNFNIEKAPAYWYVFTDSQNEETKQYVHKLMEEITASAAYQQ